MAMFLVSQLVDIVHDIISFLFVPVLMSARQADKRATLSNDKAGSAAGRAIEGVARVVRAQLVAARQQRGTGRALGAHQCLHGRRRVAQ